MLAFTRFGSLGLHRFVLSLKQIRAGKKHFADCLLTSIPTSIGIGYVRWNSLGKNNMMVRHIVAVGILCCMILPGSGGLTTARAQTSTTSVDGPVIAVLDVQQVLRRAVAAKRIRKVMEARRKKFEEEISEERLQLKGEENQFRKQSTILSPEATNNKRRVLENKVSDLRRKAEQKRGILNRAFNGATRELRQEIAKVLADLMKERNITITLARKAVLVFDQRLNVTEEVLKRLDKSLPNLKIDFKNPQK
jgi:Skp family chaperone for outer membrane proteins